MAQEPVRKGEEEPKGHACCYYEKLNEKLVQSLKEHQDAAMVANKFHIDTEAENLHLNDLLEAEQRKSCMLLSDLKLKSSDYDAIKVELTEGQARNRALQKEYDDLKDAAVILKDELVACRAAHQRTTTLLSESKAHVEELQLERKKLTDAVDTSTRALESAKVAILLFAEGLGRINTALGGRDDEPHGPDDIIKRLEQVMSDRAAMAEKECAALKSRLAEFGNAADSAWDFMKRIIAKLGKCGDTPTDRTAIMMRLDSILAKKSAQKERINAYSLQNGALTADLEEIQAEKKALKKRLCDVEASADATSGHCRRLLTDLERSKKEAAGFYDDFTRTSYKLRHITSELEQTRDVLERIGDKLVKCTDTPRGDDETTVKCLDRILAKGFAQENELADRSSRISALVAERDDLQKENAKLKEVNATLNASTDDTHLQIRKLQKDLKEALEQADHTDEKRRDTMDQLELLWSGLASIHAKLGNCGDDPHCIKAIIRRVDEIMNNRKALIGRGEMDGKRLRHVEKAREAYFVKYNKWKTRCRKLEEEEDEESGVDSTDDAEPVEVS